MSGAEYMESNGEVRDTAECLGNNRHADELARRKAATNMLQPATYLYKPQN